MPVALQKRYIAQKSSPGRGALLEQKTEWYAKDAGKSAIGEIVGLLLGDGVELPRGAGG